LNANGTYATPSGTNYLDATTTLSGADAALDSQVKTNADAISTNASGVTGEATARANQDDAIEAGAGLDADGGYTADATTNYLTAASSLKDADDRLDAQAKVNADAIAQEVTDRGTAVSGEATSRANQDDAIEAGAGLNANGTYATPSGTNYLDATTTLSGADAALDSQVKTNADAISTNASGVTGEATARANQDDAIEAGAGLNANGTYATPSGTNYLDATTTLSGADAALDSQVKTNADAISTNASGVTGEATARANQDDAIEAGAGLDADGGYTADATTNYLTAASSLKDADDKLDAQAKVNADAIAQEVTDRGTAVSGEATARANQDDAIEAGAGLNANGTYATPSGTNYLDATTTLSGADAALDSQVKTNADAISTNATSITANDFFDQTGVKLAVGAGKTWTELEAATGTFTSSASAGTLTLAAGSITDSNGAVDFGDDNLSTTGTLDAGATTLGSTLDVTGAGEFDSSLGVDGNLRVGSGGASTFQVNGTSGALSTSGDISTSGGVQASTAIVTGTALLQGTTTASTMSVSNFLTLNNEPLLDSHAATKLYVDTEIDSHTHDMPQALSFASDVYEGMGADLSADGTLSVTITVTGANLAAGTFKLHLDGGEFEVTETVTSATEISFTLTRANVLTMTSRSDVVVPQLSIDGIATGLCVFVKL